MADRMADSRPRREYGSGSVHQHHAVECPRPTNAKGESACRCPWRGVLEAGWTAAGTRRRKTRTGPTRANVERQLRDLRAQLREGTAETSRMTVKAWSDRWLRIAEGELRPNAYTANRSAVTQWIVPTIGHKRLDQLTPGDVRSVADAMRDKGRADSSQRRTHSVLTSMLKAAAEEGLPVAARVLTIKAPSSGHSDREAMTPAEAVLCLEVASRTPAGSRYVAALLQGIRQAEALGLTWDHVDLNAGVMTIEWQLKPLSYRVKRDRSSGFRVPRGYRVRRLEGAMHLVDVKTKAGERVVPLVPWFAASLEQWRPVAPVSRHGLVWPREDGRPADAKDDDAGWYALQDEAGVRHPSGRHYTIHEARHTTATLLLEAGVDPTVVGQILGQSSLQATRGYQHVRDAVAREALGKMQARLELG